MNVDVKSEHIRAGKPQYTHNCPIVLAVGGIVGWHKGRVWLQLDEKQFTPSLRNEVKVHNFMVDFDAGVKVEPFSFRALDIGAIVG
jgi:hypothetical protein